MRRPRVVIIDEHETVRRALEERLRASNAVDVVGCTGCWQEGVHQTDEHAADVVLLETKRSDGQGMATLRRLQDECPRACVIVLTSYPDAAEKEQVLDAGAARYLLKDIGSDYLVQVLRTAIAPRAPI